MLNAHPHKDAVLNRDMHSPRSLKAPRSGSGVALALGDMDDALGVLLVRRGVGEAFGCEIEVFDADR